MVKKTSKLLDRIINHTSDIIFGILSGVGLVIVTGAALIIATRLLPILQPYFIIIYLFLYLFILIATSIFYAKGWFRIIYIVSSLILSSVYVYTLIFGVSS